MKIPPFQLQQNCSSIYKLPLIVVFKMYMVFWEDKERLRLNRTPPTKLYISYSLKPGEGGRDHINANLPIKKDILSTVAKPLKTHSIHGSDIAYWYIQLSNQLEDSEKRETYNIEIDQVQPQIT